MGGARASRLRGVGVAETRAREARAVIMVVFIVAVVRRGYRGRV